MKLRVFVIVLLYVVLSSILRTSAYSQWQQMTGTILGTIPNACCGFSNIHYRDGILWAGTTVLYSSVDSGVTWVQNTTFPTGTTICEINFLDKNNGVVGTTSGVFKTATGGASWVKILNSTDCFGAEFAGSAANIVVSADGSNPGFHYTTDGGTTWTRFDTHNHNLPILAYPDGTAYGHAGGNIYKTVNFGASWQIISAIDYDSFSFARDSDASTIYFMNEEGHIFSDGQASFFKSVNGGQNWSQMTAFASQYYTSGVSVTPCAIFCQTKNVGVVRSTDKGATWQSIGGPNNFIDTRLVCAINHNIVIAADGNGNIWRTINSGGFPISSNVRHPVFASLLLKQCTYDSITIIIQGSSCSNHRVTGAVLGGKDGSLFSLNSGALPSDVTDTKFDTLKVGFHPGTAVGPFTSTVVVTITDPNTGISYDTTITVTATVTPESPQLFANTPIVTFDTANICTTVRDSVIKLTNLGCDTLRIISGPGAPGNGFTIDPVSLPVVLPPDSSIVVHIHFDPNTATNYSGDIQFKAEHKGLFQNVAVSLRGRGIGTVSGNTLDPVLLLDTVKICHGAIDTVIAIKNLGCDTLTILSGPDISNSIFSSDPLTLPLEVPPDSVVIVHIHFYPPKPGGYSTTGSFSVAIGQDKEDLPFSLFGIQTKATPGPTVLNTKINLGVVSICDSIRDTVVTFTNRGCDTLRILSGPGTLTAGFSANPLPFPIVLPPDSSIDVVFHYHGSLVGSYQTNATYQTLRTGSPVSNVVINLSVQNNGSPGGPLVSQTTFTFDTTTTCAPDRDTSVTITNHGCDTLVILNGPGPLGSVFTDDQLSFPIVLPPDSAITLHFHYRPVSLGRFTATPHFNYKRSSQSQPQGLDLFLEGITIPGQSIFWLSTDSIGFAPLSICSIDSAEFVYTNLGCDTLFVTPQGLSGDQDFTAGSGPEQALAPGDSIHIRIMLLPQQKGSRQSSYRLHIRYRDDSIQDTTIVISATINPGTHVLAATPASLIDFGTTTLCASPDSTITLTNRGCDIFTLSGSSTIAPGFVLDTTFPITLLPGESVTIRIRTMLDTIGGNTTSTASLNFSGDFYNSFPPITLSRSYRYRKNYTIHFELPAYHGAAGDTLLVNLVADSLPSDVKQISVSLAQPNDDLLTFLFARSNNQVFLEQPSILRLTGNPLEDSSGILAQLYYLVRLTSDSVTTIELSTASFNSYDPQYEECIASVTTTGSTFIFDSKCGDPTIGALLRGSLPVKIISVRPNPLSATVTLNIKASDNLQDEVHIYNILGSEVYSKQLHLTNGENQVILDLHSLPGGTYQLRLDQETVAIVKTK